MMSDDEDYDCPLCMEEFDLSDRNFRPCPCGYQICRFCWHRIKENLNGTCPACRRIYSEETVEFTPVTADELAMMKHEKKQKEREKKESEAVSRRHLANMRVVQKSLVYVIGLPPKLACDENTLRQQEYFGQYGKISKVVINRRNTPATSNGSSPSQANVGVYITYAKKEYAAKAIAAIDGSVWDGKILRASFGTTKYCTYYLRGVSCQNPGCMYLHEPGEDADSFTKEDLAVGKHHNTPDPSSYDAYSQKPAPVGRPPLPTQAASGPSTTPKPKAATPGPFHSSITSTLSDWPAPGGDKSNAEDKDEEGSALPATASWGKINSNPSTPTLQNSTLKKPDGPPPLRSKSSMASIITGVVVNSGKRKETNHSRDGGSVDSPLSDAPTPAEALAIEAAAKQQLAMEQRQQQEQLRKQQVLQKQQEAEHAELMQKINKQKQLEQEREQLALQRQNQQQEIERRMQLQKEIDEKKKKEQRARKEQEQRERKEQERLEKERLEKERLERERLEEERLEKERLERIEKERSERDRIERERLEKERQERERIERERQERLERERLENERIENERREKERLEEERLEKERQEQLEKERLEKERIEKERLEKERLEQERIERLERLERERLEKERLEEERIEKERQEMERREREAREEQERKEMERREKERLALHPPSLTLGSFSFNPDPSFANPLPAFDGTMKSGTAGPFGLDTFATIPNLPLAPAHYTGSFNPFSMDDEPLMRRSLVSSVRPLPEDMDYDPASGRSRHVGPPIPGKPRQTSRFGFAMENHYPESFDRKAYLDPSPDLQSAQDGLKTLFPNVNASFGQRNGSMTQPPQHQSQQVQYQTSPLLHRQEANLHDNPWGGVDKQDELYHRKANQLNLGSMMSAPSPHMTEHHHQPPLHQPQQLQRNGPPGLARNTMTPSMIKSPPPGLQSFERPDYENWQSQHDQQRQQYQQLQSHQPQLLQQLHQTPRLNNWTPDSTPGSHNNGSQRDGAHDFFGAFLKAAASQPIQSAPSGANAMPSLAFQDPAIMSARISSGSRKPLMDSLQQPGVGGHQGSFNPMGHDPSLDMRGRVGNNMGNSPLQQHFGLGPKRMDLYPQMKPGNMEAYPGVFGPGEPHLMNTINSAANARSAKIKSDLLMGLNAGIRPERLGVKDPPQHPQQPLGLSEEHASILNSLINGPRIGGTPATNSQFDSGSANPGAFSSVDGDYPNRSFGQHEGHNMNGMYGNNPMISMSLSSAGGVSAVPVAAPPGLGPHLNNVYSGNNGGGADIGMKRMSPSFMNNNNPNLNNYNNGNSNLNRPLDITSMMNSLEFFGPSSSSMSSPTQSVSANNTWSLPNGERMYHPEMNSSRGDSETHSRRDSAQLNTGSQFNDGMQQQQHQQHQHQVGGSTIVNGHGSDNDDSTINSDSNATHLTSSMGNMGDLGPAASTSTRVEDIQLQAINGKMETQMLENQLNAVIKRNRRKLYA